MASLLAVLRQSGWLAFLERRLLYFFYIAQFAPASLLASTVPLPVPCCLELTAAGLGPSSNLQLLRNTLWGQAGAFWQLYAMLSESRNKQVQALLLDYGNCCLRDRFAYKYPLFSLWLFTGEAGKKKVSLLLQNLPASAVVAASHLSSSSWLFQPPKFSLANETTTPMSGGWQMPVISERDGKTQVLSNWAEHVP